MRELPIIFNGEMVRAILEGRKTMTRRIIKTQPEKVGAVSITHPGNLFYFTSKSGKIGIFEPPFVIPPNSIGDHLYVRTNRFMPKKDATLWLEVTDVKAERITDITWDNAVREGWPGPQVDCDEHEGAVEWFKVLWQTLYPGSWERGDWVLAYTFRRIEP